MDIPNPLTSFGELEHKLNKLHGHCTWNDDRKTLGTARLIVSFQGKG